MYPVEWSAMAEMVVSNGDLKRWSHSNRSHNFHTIFSVGTACERLQWDDRILLLEFKWLKLSRALKSVTVSHFHRRFWPFYGAMIKFNIKFLSEISWEADSSKLTNKLSWHSSSFHAWCRKWAAFASWFVRQLQIWLICKCICWW